jgi:hypothetical protein
VRARGSNPAARGQKEGRVKRTICTGGSLTAACITAVVLHAHAPSGAIFTTLADGSEVNVNQFPSKDAVYLDGGPGIGAPADAAGLDDGIYVFQVTDPSGRTLLSTDAANCRQFSVNGGVISGVVASGCQHATGSDVDHAAVTVQLMPFDDTPNPGGVYKVWVTPLEDFPAACLASVDCDATRFHGFIPAHSKTDNFKVRDVPIREIDTVFVDPVTGALRPGGRITWIDPVGASNVKWSYYNPFWNIVEAHVEAVEDGIHQIVVEDQPACTVGAVFVGPWGQEQYVGTGPRTVSISVRGHQKAFSDFVRVHCL